MKKIRYTCAVLRTNMRFIYLNTIRVVPKYRICYVGIIALLESEHILETSMHSSRMRTTCLLSVSPRMHCSLGVSPPRGCLLWWVVGLGGVCWGGVLCIPACTEADTPPNRMIDRLCKNNLSLQAVIIIL